MNFKKWLETFTVKKIQTEEHDFIKLSKTLHAEFDKISKNIRKISRSVTQKNFYVKDFVHDTSNYSLEQLIVYISEQVRTISSYVLNLYGEDEYALDYIKRFLQHEDNYMNLIVKKIEKIYSMFEYILELDGVDDKIKENLKNCFISFKQLNPLIEKLYDSAIALKHKYNGYGGMDWRPKEAVPEDYYAL